MKTLPLILAAGHLCLGLGLASPVFAAIPQANAQPPQAVATLRPAQLAWAKELAHPVSQHTLCQTDGRQAFSAKICSILTQLSPKPSAEGHVIDIKALKANRTVWLSLPMSVRERLETYDLVVIATTQAPIQPRLAR